MDVNSPTIINDICKEFGLSQRELAEELSLSKSAIERWVKVGLNDSQKVLIKFYLENKALRKKESERDNALEVLFYSVMKGGKEILPPLK